MALTVAAAGTLASTGLVAAQDGPIIGVSWNNYNEERWLNSDEPAIKAAVEAAGGTYISTDAKSDANAQLADVENLITQGRRRAHHPRPGQGRHPAGGPGGR